MWHEAVFGMCFDSGAARLCVSGATCILSYGTLVYFAFRDLNSVGMAPTFVF